MISANDERHKTMNRFNDMLGFMPEPPDKYPDFSAYEKALFAVMKSKLVCENPIDGSICNQPTLVNHGKSGNVTQGGFRTYQIRCTSCGINKRINAILQSQGFITLKENYEDCLRHFNEKGLVQKNRQTKINGFITKPTLAKSPDEDDYPNEQDSICLEDDDAMEVEVTTAPQPETIEQFRDLCRALASANETLLKKQNEMAQRIVDLERSLQEMSGTSTKLTNRKRPTDDEDPQPKRPPPFTVAPTRTNPPVVAHAAEPIADPNREISNRELFEMIQALRNDMNQQISRPANPTATSENPTPAESLTYAKKVANGVPLKKSKLSARAKASILKMVTPKPEAAEFTKIYIPVTDNTKLKNCRNKEETESIMNQLLQQLGIRRQVTAISKIGNSLLELYVPDANKPTVDKVLTELQVKMISNVDVNSQPSYAKISKEVFEQKVVNRLAYLYNRYKWVNFRKTVLHGVDPTICLKVRALVATKENAKKERLAREAAQKLEETVNVISEDVDVVQPTPDEDMVANPSSTEPQGDVVMEATPTLC